MFVDASPRTAALRAPHGRGSAPQRCITTAVATPSKPPAARLASRSKMEQIKEDSDFLRHPLARAHSRGRTPRAERPSQMEELVSEATNINEPAQQLMKARPRALPTRGGLTPPAQFHGSYMQDHREKRAFGEGKFYQFMMRTRQPAGKVTNRLYLTMDDLADKYGNGTLRLTTRQTYQLHGVLKGDLKTVFSTVIRAMGSTLGACGDVNRNVCAPPVPYTDKPEYLVAQKAAEDIADLLAPQSGAYYDVWLDGEKFMSSVPESEEVTRVRDDNRFGTNFEGSPEPIYGTQFLPRKFKVAVTVPGDNGIDLFTNDVGLVVIMGPDGRTPLGYNVYAGGGMGRAHRNADTFARLAEPLGFVAVDRMLAAVKAIVCTQRDYGRRDDRKQARLKYLIHEWGIDKFRKVTEQYLGSSFGPLVELPPWELKTYLGWGEQGDGRLFYGVHVANGRLKGEAKRALRTVIERYELPVRLTANQDLLLADVEPAWRGDIEHVLRSAGVVDASPGGGLDPIDATSIACPALPLCGLAIGEAERGLPDINARLRAVMNRVGLPPDTPLLVRMTGCPNGCARPYMAELGFVGDGPNSYQVWLGGTRSLTRLAEPYAEKMRVDDLELLLEPVFHLYAQQRREGEELGDVVARVGFEALRKYARTYVPASAEAHAPERTPSAPQGVREKVGV